MTPTPSISSKVLPYKWEAYCRTNGRRTAVQMGGVLQYKWEVYCWVSLSSRLRSQEGPAIQMGAYCRTNWRCTAVLSSRPVGVGVSETLLIFTENHFSLSLYLSGVSQRPLTLILLQKYRNTNGSRIVIQIGGVYTALCQKEGILSQKYRDRNGRCIAILFKSIGVRGRFDSPDEKCFVASPSQKLAPRNGLRLQEQGHYHPPRTGYIPRNAIVSKQGSTPTPNPTKGAPDTGSPACIGFTVLRGGLRPWSRKGPDHGCCCCCC